MARPSKYKDEYNEIALEFLSQGKSLVQLATKLGVHRDRLYEWAKVHEEFRDALELGKQNSQDHWENKLEEMMYMKDINTPLVKLYFANRFGWSDKQESKVDHQSSDGSMSPSNVSSNDITEALKNKYANK